MSVYLYQVIIYERLSLLIHRAFCIASDFAQLSAALWHLFYSRYGGGPEVMIR